MNRKYKIFLLLVGFALVCQKPCQAQGNEFSIPSDKPIYTPTTNVKGALLGAIIYPGFKIGLERPYKYTEKHKIKLNKTKTVYKERYLTYSFGMYHHQNFHTNYFVQTEWTARRQKSKGLYFETSFGAGLSRTFLNDAAFSVNDNGDISKESMAGNWLGLASLGGSIGYNAHLKHGKPYSIYLKNQLLVFFPHNSLINLRPTIELGINYNIAGLWDAQPKRHYRVKESFRYKKAKNAKP